MTVTDTELDALRDERARETVERCWSGSRFYRERLEAAGAEPGDIRGVADLERLPILLGKDDERELQERSREELGHPFGEHLTVPVEDVVAVASTSGTTGHADLLRLHGRGRRDDRRALGSRVRLRRRPPRRHGAARLRALDVPRRRPRRAGARADGRAPRPRRRRGRLGAPLARRRPRRAHASSRARPPTRRTSPSRRRSSSAARPTSSGSRSSPAPASRALASPTSARRSQRRSARRSTTCSAARTA